MTNPLVSIGLPVYNGEKWVEQAISSLVKQKYGNIEIIIADDCSIDDTKKICKQLSSKFSHIFFIENVENLGMQGNFEKVLQLSKGKYFVWASQDDYWDENFVTLLVDKLESNPSAILAGCAAQLLVGKENKVIHELHFSGEWNPEHLNTYKLIYSLMLPANKGKWIKNNLFLHGVIRTDILQYCVSIFPGIFSHDRNFILLLALFGKWCYLDSVLYFRRHGTAVIGKSEDPIFRRKRNLFEPIICLCQMLIGVLRHRDATKSIKSFSILIILAHTLQRFLNSFLNLFSLHFYFYKLVNILKNVLPEKHYYFLKNHFKEIFKTNS